MRKILVTGAFGQIGTELTEFLERLYGDGNIVISGREDSKRRADEFNCAVEDVDVTDGEQILQVVKKHKVDTIIHLAALLSAVGEEKPQLLWDVNMNGLYNVLEVGRMENLSIFTPSSIAAFGPETPRVGTPQDTIQRPTTIYGVSKVAGELLCDYYHKKFGVDTRGVRFPGLISHVAMPGGGTTDYAVHIYYEALKNKHFTCNIKAGTKMDMMYMPDALDAIVKLIEADPSKLVHRNAFNITAMSFDPEEIKDEITKHIPEFTMDYQVDEVRQSIADSWPDSLDDRVARAEWGFSPQFDLQSMTVHMLEKLSEKLKVRGIE